MISMVEFDLQSLTKCEVAADGIVIIDFIDAHGASARMRLPLNEAGALAMTLPNLIAQALRLRYGDDTLRFAYPLAACTIEQSSDSGTRMVTLTTTDGFSVCFSMPPDMQQELGEMLTSISPSPALIVPN
jgi:hypothetical protein